MVDIEKWGEDVKAQLQETTTTNTLCEEDPHPNPEPEVTDVTLSPPPYPEGGRAAWLTVFGAFLALFCTFGQLNAFGTFQTWYAEHQLRDLPPSTIAWIGSLQLWMFFFSGGFIGRLFDAYGPRVIMIPGVIILVFSIMMTSIASQYYQYILAQGVLFGLGVGMIFYPSLSSISTHFSKYRGTALGIAFTGSGVGGVVYPIMFKQLFVQVGFGWAVRISGFMSLACCVVAVMSITSLRAPGTSSAPWFDSKHFRDIPFMLLVVGNVLLGIGTFIPFFYIADYAQYHGLSSSTGFYILSAMNGGGILGRLAPPFASDLIGRFNIMAPCAFLLGLSSLVFWIFAKSLVSILLFAILYGFLSGAFIAMLIPCVAQISEGEKLKEIGTRIGLLYSIVSFATLAGGPSAGAILKADRGSYTGMIILCGVANLSGSLFLLWARLRLNSRIFARV